MSVNEQHTDEEHKHDDRRRFCMSKTVQTEENADLPQIFNEGSEDSRY